MEEMKLLAELTKNCEEKKQKLLGMLEYFDLTDLGCDLQEQRCKDVHNRVLAENEFFCDKEFSRDTGFKIGDRITDEDYLFLLSDSDFSKVMELSLPILVEEKITDENGYFLENWIEKRCEARHELVMYIINEILPDELRAIFLPNINSIVFQDKLINAFKNSVKSAA